MDCIYITLLSKVLSTLYVIRIHHIRCCLTRGRKLGFTVLHKDTATGGVGRGEDLLWPPRLSSPEFKILNNNNSGLCPEKHGHNSRLSSLL